MKKFFIVLFFTFFSCTKVFANDSTAMLAAGGIQFSKTDAIKMLSEHLHVSLDRIKVDYVFKNLSDKDITTTIVFPLPEYKYPGMVDFTWDDEVLNDKTAPLGTFKVIVNGQMIPHRTLIRAMLHEKDITQLLKNTGIPLNTTLAENNHINEEDVDENGNPSGDYPEKQYQDWVVKAKKLGLMNKEGEPLWKKQIMYYWTQTFPAHQSVLISHEYVPSKGWNDINAWKTPDCKTDLLSINSIDSNPLWRKISMSNNICLNDDGEDVIFTNWKEYIALANNDQNYSMAHHVKYILTTGANWAGPIGNFTLDIEYPKQKAVVLYTKFYGNLPAKTIKTAGNININLKNFIPREDLSVIVFNDASS